MKISEINQRGTHRMGPNQEEEVNHFNRINTGNKILGKTFR